MCGPERIFNIERSVNHSSDFSECSRCWVVGEKFVDDSPACEAGGAKNQCVISEKLIGFCRDQSKIPGDFIYELLSKSECVSRLSLLLRRCRICSGRFGPRFASWFVMLLNTCQISLIPEANIRRTVLYAVCVYELFSKRYLRKITRTGVPLAANH